MDTKAKPFTVTEINKNPKGFTDVIFGDGFTVIQHRTKGKVYTINEKSLAELYEKIKAETIEEFCDHIQNGDHIKE